MAGETAILPVVNRLYAAAAAPGGWADALQSLVEALDAEHAFLLAGGAPEDGGFAASACVDQHNLRRALSPEAYALAAPYRPVTRDGVVVSLLAVVPER